MKINKFLSRGVFLPLLLAATQATTTANASPSSEETVVPEIIAVSKNATELFGKGFPNDVTRTVRNTDKIIFYYASIRIVNPQKQKYAVEIECIDENGDTVIASETMKEIFSINESKYLDGKSGYIETSLGLEPRVGAMVSGQKKSLKPGATYFIRLYVEKRLIGLTQFRYIVVTK